MASTDRASMRPEQPGQAANPLRNFHHARGKSRLRPYQRVDKLPTRRNHCAGNAAARCGLALALEGSAITMMRLSVLAIVLAVGIGPYASKLCGAWCAGDNPPQGCHQHLASATVVADGCCDRPGSNLGALRASQPHQQAFSPGQEAVAAHRRGAVPEASVRLRDRPARASNESCLVTVLRI